MKKVLFLVLFFLLYNFFFSMGVTIIYAGELSQTSIRLERLKANTSPGNILITATTGESVTENSLKVTVGNAWTVSSSSSNFTVSTSNLPSGTTAWPGINTSTNVSGNLITFPSSDLTMGVKYGFYITGGISTNPATGDGANYLWNIATLVGGLINNDSDLMVSIIDNDQIVVTGEVPTLASSFNVELASTDQKSSFNQNEVLNYQITYGSSYAQSTTLVLQAEWSQGTLVGSSTPSIDILDYVIGSATKAYGNVSPVVDLNNQTITWTIPIPANVTDKTVSFQLRTTSSYTGTTAVDFSVKSRISSPATTAYNAVSGQYSYSAPASTSSSTSSTPTPEATLTSAVNNFDKITINKINTSAIFFELSLNSATSIKANYGTSLANLNQHLIFPSMEKFHQVAFTNLENDTIYFFKFTTNEAAPISSDILSVKTASQDSKVSLKKNTLIVTGDRNLLWDAKRNCFDLVNDCIPVITIPKQSEHEFIFEINNPEEIDRIHILIENSRIRGMSTENNFIQNAQTDLIEISPGVYQARVVSPALPGEYNVIVKIIDIYGNESSQEVMIIQVVDPIRISDEDGNPIEHARVHFYKYKEQLQLFEILRPGSLLEQNPLYTDPKGQILITLPHGKYRIEIDILGYEPIIQEFTLSPDLSDNYPHLITMRTNTKVLDYVRYHTSTLKDVWAGLDSLLHRLSTSKRFYQVSFFATVFVFYLLLPLSLAAKTHVPLLKLPAHFFHLINRRFSASKMIRGRVINEKNKSGLKGVEIIILDIHNGRVLSSTHSGNRGYFHFLPPRESIKIQLNKKGYFELEQIIITDLIDPKDKLIIELAKNKTLSKTIMEQFKNIFSNLLELGFEMIIIFALIFSILFIINYGFLNTIPLLLFSCFNLLFGFLYLSGHKD